QGVLVNDVTLTVISKLHIAVQSSWQWLHFSSDSGILLHWQWELLLPVGTLYLAVGMPCAFYSQQEIRMEKTEEMEMEIMKEMRMEETEEMEMEGMEKMGIMA
nr:hypothetical protein [Tanacetum cinerariifolium]